MERGRNDSEVTAWIAIWTVAYLKSAKLCKLLTSWFMVIPHASEELIYQFKVEVTTRLPLTKKLILSRVWYWPSQQPLPTKEAVLINTHHPPCSQCR